MNGKKYDAKTGALLLDAFGTPAPSRSIDGFNDRVTPVTIIAPIKIVPEPIVSRPSMGDIVRSPAKHTTKKQQGSKTLMRHAVHKPHMAKPIKAISALSSTHTTITPKQTVNSLDQRRSAVAKHVPQSTAIKKFAPLTMHTNPAQLHGAKPVQHKPIAHKPVIAHHSNTADMLQRAIEHATSHEEIYEPAKKFARSRRAVSVTAAVAALFIILGYAGFYSVTPLKLRVASSKAGFSVEAPDYKPAGFSLAAMSYTAGNAGLHYTSNSDDRAFSIIQKASQWDSSTLLNMVVEPTGKQYQTIESAGRTIFVDEQHTANWVNGGIWYQVQNENALSDKQIIDIANSL